MSQSDPYADLRQNLHTGNVSAFVGAGLSIGAGLPGWYAMITELMQRIGQELPPKKWVTGDALIDAAQTYINDQGLNSLVRFLKSKLDTAGRHPSAAHQALAVLPISVVFTANYDDLLERAYRDVGKRVHTVVQDTDIPFMQREPDCVNVIKLYGDLDQPDTLVLARQQYESFFLHRPQLVKLLETEVGRSDMLYLGWSHSDPHFGLVFGELLNRFGDFMRPGYAAMFDVAESKQKELERKHIRLVQLPSEGDRTAQLAAWLSDLATSESHSSGLGDAPKTEHRASVSQPTSLTASASGGKRAEARPAMERSDGDGQLSYERGLAELEKCFKVIGGQQLEEFLDYSRQLLANLQEEHRYGGDSALSRERNKITGSMNRLTMRSLNESFNDFALGRLRCTETVGAIDPVMSKLDAIHTEVKEQGMATRRSISDLRGDILGHFDAKGRDIVGEVVAELNRAQVSTVREVVAALEDNAQDEDDLSDTLDDMAQALRQLQEQIHELDSPKLVKAADEVLAAVSEPEISVRHKLKLTVPLVPLLLSYEGELEVGQELRLEGAWSALKRKLGIRVTEESPL